MTPLFSRYPEGFRHVVAKNIIKKGKNYERVLARSMRLPLSTKPAISKYNLGSGAMSRSPTRCVQHLDMKDLGRPPENIETAAQNISPRLPSQPWTVSAIFRSEQFISLVETTGTLKLIFRSEQFTLQADATSHESQSSSQLIEKFSRADSQNGRISNLPLSSPPITPATEYSNKRSTDAPPSRQPR